MHEKIEALLRGLGESPFQNPTPGTLVYPSLSSWGACFSLEVGPSGDTKRFFQARTLTSDTTALFPEEAPPPLTPSMETRLRLRVTQERSRRREAGAGLQHRPAAPTEDAERGQGDLHLGLHLLQMHLPGGFLFCLPRGWGPLGKPKRRRKDVRLDWPLLRGITVIHICMSQMGPSVLAMPPRIPMLQEGPF